MTLRTGEIVLRAPHAGDAAAFAAACADPVSQRWLPLPRVYTEATARRFIDTCERFRENGDGIRCAIALAEDDALVGMVSLKQTDWLAKVTDVGYWACPEHRGRGHITRATRELSVWALEQGLERIELRAAPANTASNRVARAAGFTLEGVMRRAGFIHGGRVDLNLYSLVRPDLAGAGAGGTESGAGAGRARPVDGQR